MEFLGLVLINVFMGALFYFIISLKLEKSASEFRERKLRKEMEAIINEFNSAAERNISILEHKISVIKRLMEASGNIKSFNAVISEDMRHNPENKIMQEEPDVEIIEKKKNIPENKSDLKTEAEKKDLNYYVHGALNFISSAKEFFYSFKKDPIKDPVIDTAIEEKFSFEDREVSHFSIEKELKIPADAELCDKRKEIKNSAPDEKEIIEVFNAVNDKLSLYTAISDLHMKGCGINDLSHYSGLPAGEIKLVLNLHGVKNI